jgi:hypothetical protein
MRLILFYSLVGIVLTLSGVFNLRMVAFLLVSEK